MFLFLLFCRSVCLRPCSFPLSLCDCMSHCIWHVFCRVSVYLCLSVLFTVSVYLCSYVGELQYCCVAELLTGIPRLADHPPGIAKLLFPRVFNCFVLSAMPRRSGAKPKQQKSLQHHRGDLPWPAGRRLQQLPRLPAVRLPRLPVRQGLKLLLRRLFLARHGRILPRTSPWTTFDPFFLHIAESVSWPTPWLDACEHTMAWKILSELVSAARAGLSMNVAQF